MILISNKSNQSNIAIKPYDNEEKQSIINLNHDRALQIYW